MIADFILVGAGTAGCVLANRLAARGASVLLIEAGASHRHRFVRIPAAFPKLFKSPRDWADSTVGQPALNGRRIFWPRGKMLGGSSSMNAQIHQWCSAEDFERWVALGANGWGWEAMAPALGQVDAELNGGPLREPNPLTTAFLRSAEAEGLPSNGSYNGGRLEAGVWTAEVAHRNGARWSAADAYLTPSKRLRISTGGHVLRVLFEGRSATGVELRIGREIRRAHASRGVVLCAGTVGSAQTLLRSGIGPAASLRAFGIDVVTDSPNVGENLQDHLMFVMHFRARRPISLRAAESPANLWRYLSARRGMLASNVAEAIAFTASRPDHPIDLEIVFAPVLFENEGLTPPSAHGFSLAPILLAPKSRGRVALSGPDADAAPLIDPAYLSDTDGEDLARLVHATRLADRIASRDPLAAESAGRMWPPDLRTETLVDSIRATAHTIYHPVGTCRMGSDRDSVVDCTLRVRGTDRLWVADASVMPAIPTGHPNAVVAAIGHRAAELVAP